ncbi:MAG: hypothetical protein CMB64_06175 [Euryarchaeota archaeon]|nr:hypothetical protein [Euryarchaeota archaeon]
MVFTCIIICSLTVTAENNLEVTSENENIYFGVYIILFFAFFGWVFFLILLGAAIYLAIRQFKTPKLFSMKSVRKRRVKCK